MMALLIGGVSDVTAASPGRGIQPWNRSINRVLPLGSGFSTDAELARNSPCIAVRGTSGRADIGRRGLGIPTGGGQVSMRAWLVYSTRAFSGSGS